MHYEIGGNALCLKIWSGMDAGPFMHSIHFSYSLGCLLSPLVASQFLSLPGQNSQSNTGIKHLYVLAGIPITVISFGYQAVPKLFPEALEKLRSADRLENSLIY